MKSRELISVIIPIYKVEKYLDKCIQSVVDQTYPNLEIILVDDGSPDSCPKICDDWKKKDERVKVIHKENGGLSDARNVGLAIAEGEYIGFVDSDDYIDSKMYEKLYLAIKNANADLAICSFDKVSEDGNILSGESLIKNEIFTGREGLGKILDIDVEGWQYVTAWNKLYSRKSLNGIKFPVGKINEDQFIAHYVFFQCDKVVSLEEKLYKYVQRSGSIMTAIKGVKYLDEVEALCERFEFYRENGLTEYYSKLLTVLKMVYTNKRVRLTGIYNLKDKKRLQEIDRMFKKNYFKYTEKASIREKIKYMFPSIGLKIKNEM